MSWAYLDERGRRQIKRVKVEEIISVRRWFAKTSRPLCIDLVQEMFRVIDRELGHQTLE